MTWACSPAGCWWSTAFFKGAAGGRRAGGADRGAARSVGAGRYAGDARHDRDDDHPFDPRQTPCPGLGVVADTFWRMPGVLRSNSPFSFSAAGAQAARILTPTRPMLLWPEQPHRAGLQLDGQVLLLGIDHTAIPTSSLAESLSGVRYRRKKYPLLQNGQPTRFDYGEIDHCCQNFALVDGWLDARGLQRTEPWDARGRGWPARGTWWRW